jgi:hypothetical protein
VAKRTTGKGTTPSDGGHVVVTSTRGELGWTLEDVADLVEVQGYSAEYAARKTGFTLAQVESFLRYRTRAATRRPAERD